MRSLFGYDESPLAGALRNRVHPGREGELIAVPRRRFAARKPLLGMTGEGGRAHFGDGDDDGSGEGDADGDGEADGAGCAPVTLPPPCGNSRGSTNVMPIPGT